MKAFMNEDFLLESDAARSLYHDHAARLPIIDYHCHLSPQEIADDRRWDNITELWLGGDHYKWRAMRTNGVAERYTTGDATPWEKFEQWAATVPYCFRNPLYHWTHLELQTAFGITTPLNPETAREIYDACNDRLRHDPHFSARGLMRRYRVETVCTTDDPTDTLLHHKKIRESGFEVKVLPTFRPDKAMAIEGGEAFTDYLRRLAESADADIRDFQTYLDALDRRHRFFHEMGCRLSDHGLSEFYAEAVTDAEAADIFARALNGQTLTDDEVRRFKSRMLLFFGELDAERDWTQQYHYGTIRNANSRMLRTVGPDTGFDSIGEWPTADALARLLDRLDSRDRLPRTILYNLNPAANEVMGTMIGNFQDGSLAGKIQWGAAWWFNDHLMGMARQMDTLSALGLLSRFVGMLTDSRSFLSYPRHDYFRRLLCNLIGRDIEQGLIPATGYERRRAEQMVEDVSYYNAKRYFKF